MTGWRGLGALAVLASVAAAAPPPEGPAEEIFPAGPREPTPEARAAATTTYWKVALEIRLGAAPSGGWLRVMLPRSDGRQTVVAREISAEGFITEEVAEPPNILGVFTLRGPAEGASTVAVDTVAEVTETRVEPPTAPFPPAAPPPALAPLLAPSPFIQSDDAEIRRRARAIIGAAKRLDEAAWALFQYTASFLKSDPDSRTLDARSVLRDEKGSGAGKARLLTAFLRSVGIPAEVVGGLRLADATKTRGTTSWVEAWLGDRWFPMDPANGSFGRLPDNYLMLYRGDRPLIVHRAGVPVEYEFLTRQVTRQSVFEPQSEGGSRLRKARRVAPPSLEGEGMQTLASYVEKSVATVVVLTDQEVPPAVADRMRAEARQQQIDLVLLVSHFQSRYFRESTLKRLAANHLSAIRDADVLLVSTRDEAGLYALLGLGDGRLRLTDSRIVVTGSFARSVGQVLGAIVVRLYEPGELAIDPQRSDLLSLWEVARASVIRGVPLLEESARWGIAAEVLDDAALERLSTYRQYVIGGWARAVRAQVPLEALNLILVLPFIAFIVVLARNFVGLDTFGTFSPVIVSLAFLTTGVTWGTVIFVVIVGLGALLRGALQLLRLHLVARVAILIALVAGVMTGLTVIGASLGVGALLHVSLFPMVIMSNLIENFTASQVEYGTRTAVRLTANTLLVCVVCTLVVEETGLPSLILAFPECLLGVIALEIVLGKWRGLRLLEYRRFLRLMRPSGRRSQGGA